MRTFDQIQKITSRIIDPYTVEDFLSSDQIAHLLNLFNSNEHTQITKNTGPVTLDINYLRHDQIVRYIFSKIEDLIGPFNLTSGFFFKVTYPHIIHNDDVFDLPDVYRGITIPLKCEGNFTEYPKLYFFDQFYFHGPAKFFNGSSNVPTYYNKQVYEYSEVSFLNNNGINQEIKDRYLTHIKDDWFYGLSIKSAIDWHPGNAIVFDSTRLHCASDFRNLDITSKTAISIFTSLT